MDSVAFAAPVTLRKPRASTLSPASFCCTPFLPSLPLRTRYSPSIKPQFAHVSMTSSNVESSSATSSSTGPFNQTRPPFKSLLTGIKTEKVDPETGRELQFWEIGKPHEKIYKAKLRLRDGPVGYLPVETSRKAHSRVYGLKRVIDSDMCNTPFIVFGHGFAIPPTLYFSLLCYLGLQGYVIIAPTVNSPVRGQVETIGPDDSSAAKIQTALLIDSARSFDVALDYGSEVHLFGHSMGGGMALVFAEYAAAAVQSVGLMAPEVGGLELTTLNKHVRLNDDDGIENMETLAQNIKCKVMIMRSKGDSIVPKGDMEKLMSAFRCSPSVPLTGLLTLEDGNHFGYEDMIPNMRRRSATQSYFGLKNVLSSDFIATPPELARQLRSTKAVYKAWFEHATDEENRLKNIMETTETASKGTFEWN